MRIAALIKQVPEIESLQLGPDGRLVREGLRLVMNDYCRRAVAAGTRLARSTGGSLTVMTLGPPTAEAVLRESHHLRSPPRHPDLRPRLRRQ